MIFQSLPILDFYVDTINRKQQYLSITSSTCINKYCCYPPLTRAKGTILIINRGSGRPTTEISTMPMLCLESTDFAYYSSVVESFLISVDSVE